MWSPPSRRRDAQVSTNLASQEVIYLSVPRDAGEFVLRRVVIDRMPSPFAQERTAAPFKVRNKVLAFHLFHLNSRKGTKAKA
jgi:hypothetical protein